MLQWCCAQLCKNLPWEAVPWCLFVFSLDVFGSRHCCELWFLPLRQAQVALVAVEVEVLEDGGGWGGGCGGGCSSRSRSCRKSRFDGWPGVDTWFWFNYLFLWFSLMALFLIRTRQLELALHWMNTKIFSAIAMPAKARIAEWLSGFWHSPDWISGIAVWETDGPPPSFPALSPWALQVLKILGFLRCFSSLAAANFQHFETLLAHPFPSCFLNQLRFQWIPSEVH